MAKREYYEVLGVPRTATPDQVKSAYRKLARAYHPDVNKAKDAPARFKEATAAYEVLSDPQKRQMYDQFGSEVPPGFGAAGHGPGPRGGPRTRTYTWSPGQGGAPFGGGGGFEDVFANSPFAGMSLEELLASLGGGRQGRRTRGAPAAPAPAGQDMEYPVTLDFMQAIRGTTTALQFEHPDGQVERIDVKIPPGVKEGSKIRVRGKGGLGPGGRGDLYILIHVREHPCFRRQDDDIYLDLPVSLAEAALGAEVTVPTIDGHAAVKVPACTSSGMQLRLRGRGAADPKTGQRGDQYVAIKIVLPETLSPKGKQLVEEFAKSDPYDPRRKVRW